ncbi:MAG: hypothetical protein L3J81_06010 [Thermoplasmata archaeon]|nr:hypothetical protein [Thermoplasmata archaeon]
MLDPRVAEKPERFVAVATSKTSRRVDAFVAAAERNRSAVLDWVSELSAAGLRPSTSILEIVGKASWPTAREFWVKALRSEGAALLNADPDAKKRKHRMRDDIKQDSTFPKKIPVAGSSSSPDKTDEERLADMTGIPIEAWGKGLEKARQISLSRAPRASRK